MTEPPLSRMTEWRWAVFVFVGVMNLQGFVQTTATMLIMIIAVMMIMMMTTPAAMPADCQFAGPSAQGMLEYSILPHM